MKANDKGNRGIVKKAEDTCILCNTKVGTYTGEILCEKCRYNVESDYEAKCL